MSLTEFYVTVQAGTSVQQRHETFQDYEARGEGNEYRVTKKGEQHYSVEPVQWFHRDGKFSVEANCVTLEDLILAMELVTRRVENRIANLEA